MLNVFLRIFVPSGLLKANRNMIMPANGIDGGGFRHRDLTEDFCAVLYNAERPMRISQLADELGETTGIVKRTALAVEELGEATIDRDRHNWLVTLKETDW
jgi:hypothetical protein